jgi:hypothetical protein
MVGRCGIPIERRILGLFARKNAPENSPALTESELKELQGPHKRAMLYLGQRYSREALL